MTEEIIFCACGLPLYNGICKRCKGKIKRQRERIGKYSGKSKTPYGGYEER